MTIRIVHVEQSPAADNYMTAYNDAFHHYQMHGSLRSAQVVVLMVLEPAGAERVINVGCGTGTWLSVYRDHGIDDFPDLA